MTDIEQHKDQGSILFVIGVCIVASSINSSFPTPLFLLVRFMLDCM